MFSAVKDQLTSQAARAFLNERIKQYGAVDELVIDSKRGRIQLTCTLSGEASPIGITVEKYQIAREDGKTHVEVLESTATRPWLAAVMRDHLHGRKIPLPAWAAAAL